MPASDFLLLDGFDAYDTQISPAYLLTGKWLSRISAPRSSIVEGGVGGYGKYLLQRTDGGSAQLKLLSKTWTPDATIHVGFHYWRADANLHEIVGFYDGSGNRLGLIAIEATSNIPYYYQGAAQLAKGATGLPIQSWVFIEASVTFHDSTGAVELFVNGMSVGSATGVDTIEAGASGGCAQIGIAGVGSGTGGGNSRFDSLYVHGSVRQGPGIIRTRFPNADTATEDWSLSAGSDSYALVDDPSPDGDSTYLYTSSVGNTTILSFPSTSGAVAAPKVVQVNILGRKQASGSGTLVPRIVSGATASDGSGTAVDTDYALAWDLWENDPNTATDWTRSAADAIDAGPKLTS